MIYLSDKSQKAKYSPNVKATFEQKDGGIVIQVMPPSDESIFSINNLNLYNDLVECIKIASEEEYINAFQLELGVSNKIKAIDVADYLDFHYMASSNQEKFLRVVKIVSLMETLKMRPAKLLFIKEWIDKIEKQDTTSQDLSIKVGDKSTVQIMYQCDNSMQVLNEANTDKAEN